MFKGKHNRRGFFFVVTSLILLVYIMTNLSLWSKTISLQEETYSENFKISNIDYAASQITEKSMKEFAKIATNYALYRLNGHSIDNPVESYEKISSSIYGLITEGEVYGSDFEGNGDPLIYSAENKSSYTFAAVFETINDSFSTIGMQISAPEITNFYFNQSSTDTINVSFNLSFEVSDLQGYASIERDIPVSFNLSIKGLVDPSIARGMKGEEYGSQEGIEKQIFFHPPGLDPNNDGIKITAGSSGEGQGWFYGYVYKIGASPPPSDDVKSFYSIMGSEEAITDEENYAQYGAYIVIKEDPATTFSGISLRHDGKPVFASTSEPSTFDCGTLPKCILFVSEFEPGAGELGDDGITPSAESYNIENFRDFVVCGYYFKNQEGPSYFQKLLTDSYNLGGSEEFGMATFLVWKDIEGGYDSDEYSRLDIEFFGGTDGIRIKGMPGCKSKVMCSEPDSFIGQFKLSWGAMEDYLGEPDIKHYECSDVWADCGDLG